MKRIYGYWQSYSICEQKAEFVAVLNYVKLDLICGTEYSLEKNFLKMQWMETC